MARENPRWGYFRIRGELLKLGYTVSATTIRSVLRSSHVPPAERRSQMTWRQFLAAHAESLVATDFFTVDTVFFKRLYVLFFVHMATRRFSACTAEPNSAWVTQQARNLNWKLNDEGINLRVVIHDRDRKFARSFDTVFESDGAQVILTPLMAPKANAALGAFNGGRGARLVDMAPVPRMLCRMPELSDAELDSLAVGLEILYKDGKADIAHVNEAQIMVALVRSLRQFDRTTGRYSKVMVALTLVIAGLTITLAFLTWRLVRLTQILTQAH